MNILLLPLSTSNATFLSCLATSERNFEALPTFSPFTERITSPDSMPALAAGPS